MYTIRDLCKISKLSRSTILYYDSLGLLKPAERSASNYRLYSDESVKVLKKICLYREAGVSLDDIKTLVNVPENCDKKIDILEKTLFRLNDLVRKVQQKQSSVIDMIKAVSDRNDIGSAFDDQYFADSEKRIATFAFDVSEATGISRDEFINITEAK